MGICFTSPLIAAAAAFRMVLVNVDQEAKKNEEKNEDDYKPPLPPQRFTEGDLAYMDVLRLFSCEWVVLDERNRITRISDSCQWESQSSTLDFLKLVNSFDRARCERFLRVGGEDGGGGKGSCLVRLRSKCPHDDCFSLQDGFRYYRLTKQKGRTSGGLAGNEKCIFLEPVNAPSIQKRSSNYSLTTFIIDLNMSIVQVCKDTLFSLKRQSSELMGQIFYGLFGEINNTRVYYWFYKVLNEAKYEAILEYEIGEMPYAKLTGVLVDVNTNQIFVYARIIGWFDGPAQNEQSARQMAILMLRDGVSIPAGFINQNFDHFQFSAPCIKTLTEPFVALEYRGHRRGPHRTSSSSLPDWRLIDAVIEKAMCSSRPINYRIDELNQYRSPILLKILKQNELEIKGENGELDQMKIFHEREKIEDEYSLKMIELHERTVELNGRIDRLFLSLQRATTSTTMGSEREKANIQAEIDAAEREKKQNELRKSQLSDEHRFRVERLNDSVHYRIEEGNINNSAHPHFAMSDNELKQVLTKCRQSRLELTNPWLLNTWQIKRFLDSADW